MWSGTDLIVMNEVAVSPPYTPENVRGKTPDSKAYVHVKKLVEKHQQQWQERAGSLSKDATDRPGEEKDAPNVARH
jgi:hypothetical protein